MNHEQSLQPAYTDPAEAFGFSEREKLFWRVSQERFQSILEDEQTVIHRIQENSNDMGEFLFVTASRPGKDERIAFSFYGLGYHDYRERWLTDEWFWYQASLTPELLAQQIEKSEAQDLLRRRMELIQADAAASQQTDRGRFFELLADLTDEDGAIAEMEDLDALSIWLFADPVLRIPRKTELLDLETREKLPRLYSNEGKGIEALAQVKFFTPDSNWTWYASEFDGEDTFFGLVSGMEVELEYFSLKELEEARGPLGLPIERDMNFEPKTLGELVNLHTNNQEQGSQ